MLASQRDLFEIPRDICYLNSASWSPLPLRTQQAARAAVGRKGQPWTLDAGFANRQHDRARVAASRLINADPADVALIPSISYGVATAAKLLTIARGARVIVLENDHSSPVLEWQTRAEAQGFAVETIRQPDDGDWMSAILLVSNDRARRLLALHRFRRCTGRTAGRSTSNASAPRCGGKAPSCWSTRRTAPACRRWT